MSRPKGGFRFFEAVTSVIGWPARVKLAPFSVPDIEKIPAFRDKDRATSTSPHWTVEKNDADRWSEIWKVPFTDPSYNTLQEFARDHALNTESVNDTSASIEDVPMIPLADMDAMEDGIRREADPRGMISRDTIDTASLVKYIKKRQRDSVKELQRNKDDMRIEREELQHKLEDEKDRLYRIIRGQNEAMRARDEQGQQIRDDYCELQFKYQDLLEDNKAKDTRITELKGEVAATFDTCQRVTKGSVEALKRADRQMEYRIVRIQIKHQQELGEIREWNEELQERLKIARRLQPVILLHRAQVGTVCEMHEKLVQLKKSKIEELAAKDKENEKLRNQTDYQEREIDDLKSVAEADGKVLQETAALLSDTRKALSEAEGKIGSHEREVKTLNRWGKTWENGYRAKEEECVSLKSQMNTLKADQRMKLIKAQAHNEGLQTSIGFMQEANYRMDKELESWENGHGGSLRVSGPKHNDSQTRNEAASLAKALKAANARADALQISVNALQAEKGVLERQLENAATAYNPQVQEQVERLESKNQNLSESAERAATLEIQLRAQLAEEEQTRVERFANRTRELEAGFDQGFENLRELRNKWLLHKRGLEEQHNREMVAGDYQHEIERQGREAQLAKVWKEKEEEVQRKEEELQSREKQLASQVRHLHSGGQNLIKMEARATRAEREVLELQVAAINDRAHRDLIERNLENEIDTQRRDGQRHLDLLNEETSKMAEWSRLPDLHNELQTANCSLNSFKYKLKYEEANNETLIQGLYGADFYESDVSFLQDEGRPVLLAQLQAAKWTLERLRSLLAESPNFEVNKALSIVMGPRGDENAAQLAEDIFGPSNEDQQFAPQINLRKRTGAPLGSPTYGDHDDNAASDDWGNQDQEALAGARLSTSEEISNRQKRLLKSRRNRRPANAVPLEIIDPAIRDQ